jgi:hypothetical protein
LKQIGRREWWLWLSAFFVTLLSAVALVLSSMRSFFPRPEHFYEIRPAQARWGAMCLLLLFNGWQVYRQWSLRRARRHLTGQDAGVDAAGAGSDWWFQRGSRHGFVPPASAEQQLGKEIARAAGKTLRLSIATIRLEEFTELTQRYGLSPAADQG